MNLNVTIDVFESVNGVFQCTFSVGSSSLMRSISRTRQSSNLFPDTQFSKTQTKAEGTNRLHSSEVIYIN